MPLAGSGVPGGSVRVQRRVDAQLRPVVESRQAGRVEPPPLRRPALAAPPPTPPPRRPEPTVEPLGGAPGGNPPRARGPPPRAPLRRVDAAPPEHPPGAGLQIGRAHLTSPPPP